MPQLGVAHGVATIMASNALAKVALGDRYLGMRKLLTMFADESLEVRVILDPNAPAEGGGVSVAITLAQAESDRPNMDGSPGWIAAERCAALPNAAPR